MVNKPGKNELYFPLLIKLPLISSTVEMNYIEILDESSIEVNHVHDYYEICFCLENKLSIKAGVLDHVLVPGDFLFIMPGTPHNVVYLPDEEKKYSIMVFDIPHIEGYDEKNRPLITGLKKLSNAELAVRGRCPVDEISAILSKMERELSGRRTGWRFLFRGYCLEFLFYCLREVLPPNIEPIRKSENYNLAIEITKYMRENYSKKISLENLADTFHISPRHAQRVFSDYFGISFAKALNLYRVNHAKDFLTRTDLPIDIIAERVGLSSAQTLSRLFRDYEQRTVTEYRSQSKALARIYSAEQAVKQSEKK